MRTARTGSSAGPNSTPATATCCGPQRKESDIKLYASRLHELNFIECIQSRKPTITPVEVAHRSTSVCHIGAICLDLGRPLEWDPVAEKFVNDDEANKRLAV